MSHIEPIIGGTVCVSEVVVGFFGRILESLGLFV